MGYFGLNPRPEHWLIKIYRRERCSNNGRKPSAGIRRARDVRVFFVPISVCKTRRFFFARSPRSISRADTGGGDDESTKVAPPLPLIRLRLYGDEWGRECYFASVHGHFRALQPSNGRPVTRGGARVRNHICLFVKNKKKKLEDRLLLPSSSSSSPWRY